MDLFGRKRIAQLKCEVANLTSIIKNQTNDINQLEASELQLIDQIHEMDQFIFNMTQCTSWEQMRPIFNELQAPMERRKRLESERIQTILIPEMKKAYR